MIKKIKQGIVMRSLKKRAKTYVFDDAASEHFELPKDAATDQNNSYYFSAHSPDGTSLFLRLGKRGGGEREVWLGYLGADGTAFANSQTVYSESDCPVTLKCITPLKKWQIDFVGKLKQAKAADDKVLAPYGAELDAEFSAVFDCTDKLYDFTRDSDPIPFARAVSEEKWSKQFFADLNSNNQTHTEQGGYLSGALTVGDKIYTIDAPAMRDHSFGKREWGYMNRHIWLMAVSAAQNLNVNMVSYPALRGLRTGYLTTSDGKTANVTDATPLSHMPSSGTTPESFNYSCKLSNGESLICTCTPIAAFKFVMGGNYVIYEGIADYDIEGKKARGIAEFGYNMDTSRWKD